MLSTPEFALLVHKRHQILVQLRDLGQTQSMLIERGDTATLLRLLSVKQRVLAGLQATEHQMAPYHDEDPESRMWASPLERDNCANEADQCRELLREVLELERRQEQMLLARRNEAAAELRQVQSAREATGAYRANRRTPNQSHAASPPHLLALDATPLDVSSDA
jgi:hypothetical protein